MSPATLHARRRATLAIAGPFLLASALVAQGNLSTDLLTESASPIAEVDIGGSSELWAAGRNYKVSFHNGMRFYPHVGPTLGHQPFSWVTSSVRAGGRSLSLNPPVPQWQEFRCDYDLGAITERYEVLDDGIEQRFFLRRNPGLGALTIEGTVHTPLRLQMQDGGASIEMLLPDDRPVVSYGEAVLIDANGRRTSVARTLLGRTISLQVPEADMASAAYPIVIDPFISNVLQPNGGPISDCDVMHETLSPVLSQSRTWVSYTREVALGDDDLWVVRFATGFGGTAIPVHREVSGYSSRNGRIALCPGGSKAVIVYETGIGGGVPGAASFVAVHTHDLSDLTMDTAFSSPFSTLTDNDTRPVIGGRFGSGSELLIVWQRDDNAAGLTNTATSRVYAAVFDPTVFPAVVVNPFVVRNRLNRDQERPTANRSAGGAEWLVAFQEHDGTVANDDWDIAALAVDNLGAVSTSSVDLAEAGTTTQHKLGPQLAGSDGRYLLTYALRQFQLPNPKPQSILGEELRAQRIDWNHSTDTGTRPHASVLLSSQVNAVGKTGGIAFDRRSTCHWCVTTHNEATEAYNIYKLGYRGGVVESGSFTPAAGITVATGGITFNHVQRAFQLVFGANNGTANGNRLYGGLMSYDPVQPATTYGIACGSGTFGGLAAMVDRQQVGAENLQFRLVNAPADTFGLLALSLANTNQSLNFLGLFGCDLLVSPGPALLGSIFLPISAGQASFDVDLPEGLAPFTLFAQWGYVVPGANPADMLASEGLGVQIGR